MVEPMVRHIEPLVLSVPVPQLIVPEGGAAQEQPHVASAAVSPLRVVKAVAGAPPGQAGAAAAPEPETRTIGPVQPAGAAGAHTRSVGQLGPASLPASVDPASSGAAS